ncbi:MAG: pilus (MSHA type) biogenesis protein MshL [Epsilonproteobacteria bacterium]|nr:pilus (MSHA type) biogenesis protein MshL [Campylobacterota bacterium]NPA64821.1 pilus (MSHA type) biogenesis protein MshL [Campylobacterota bacterium]
MKKTALLLATLLTILSPASASSCDTKLFTFKSRPGITISEFLSNLSDECGFTIIVKDRYAKKKLRTRLSKMDIQDVTLHELLDLILNEYGIYYELDKNILKIRYLLTKTFHVDYVISKRSSETVTDASVDVGGVAQRSGTVQKKTRDVNKIRSVAEFDLWKDLKKEIFKILNRPEDEYKAPEPIVNPSAGLLTVTATLPQIQRVQNYIQSIQDRLHKEVLIDVSILAVVYNKNITTGIDWSRFSLTLNGDYDSSGNFVPTNPIATYQSVGVGSNFKNLDFASTATAIINSSLHMSAIIDFLEKSGKVVTLSNPKILALNNQPAIISIGDTLNYNVPTTITISGNGNLGTQSYTPSSVFVGILLNITPEITQDGSIILRINPSISELRDPDEVNRLYTDGGFREIAPDTKEKKISTVVKLKDGSTLILGGLISNTKNFKINGVPILKDIPLFGYLFKSKRDENQRFELVFIIRPKIIDTDKEQRMDLKEFGYRFLDEK